MEGEGQGRTKRSQEGQEEDSDVMWDWVFFAGLDLKYGLYGLSAYGKDWSSDAAISSGGNDLLRHLHRKRAIISVFSEDEAFVRQIQIPFDRRQTCNWEPGNGICQGQEANAIHKLRSTSKKQSQPLACLTTVRQGSRVGTPNWLSVKTCYVITGFSFPYQKHNLCKLHAGHRERGPSLQTGACIVRKADKKQGKHSTSLPRVEDGMRHSALLRAESNILSALRRPPRSPSFQGTTSARWTWTMDDAVAVVVTVRWSSADGPVARSV